MEGPAAVATSGDDTEQPVATRLQRPRWAVQAVAELAASDVVAAAGWWTVRKGELRAERDEVVAVLIVRQRVNLALLLAPSSSPNSRPNATPTAATAVHLPAASAACCRPSTSRRRRKKRERGLARGPRDALHDRRSCRHSRRRSRHPLSSGPALTGVKPIWRVGAPPARGRPTHPPP